jgi:hypothetical protein
MPILRTSGGPSSQPTQTGANQMMPASQHEGEPGGDHQPGREPGSARVGREHSGPGRDEKRAHRDGKPDWRDGQPRQLGPRGRDTRHAVIMTPGRPGIHEGDARIGAGYSDVMWLATMWPGGPDF